MIDVDKLAKIEVVDLRTGNLTLRPNARTISYFTVNTMNDREAIRKIAMSLILSGCREFHFYGKQEDLWHQIFDEVDIQINPNASDATKRTGGVNEGYNRATEFFCLFHQTHCFTITIRHRHTKVSFDTIL